MNSEQRSTAVFGAFDGVVSIVGFVFGLLLHHSPMAAIAIGGLGGAISATVSMSVGTFESEDGAWHRRLINALFMAAATLLGSAVPIWPFFVFGRVNALIAGAIGSLLVASWIGFEKRSGWKGYATAYATLLGAVGLTLLIVSLIPASA
jgi:VIT1/CCC1 family predicted Fe2+/Mn2+ transporter